MPERTRYALIVSHSLVLRELIAGFIVQSDLPIDEIFCASGAEEASQICERFQVDVLIAEDLPELSRGVPQPSATLIIGPPSPDKIQRLLDGGASVYLVKPFSKERLIREVHLALARQAPAGQTVQVSQNFSDCAV